MYEKITMNDIRKRLSSVNSGFKANPSINAKTLCEQAKNTTSIGVVERFLENWDALYSNKGQCFTEVMEVFKEFWNKTDNVGDIQKVSNIICLNILPRLETSNPIHDLVITQSRDARNVFKRQVKHNADYLKTLADPKTGSIQTKDLNNNDKKTIDGVNPLPDKTDTTDQLDPKAAVKQEAVLKAYSNIEETAAMIKVCDRVLSNHNKLSRRFNIDKIVKESINSTADIQDCVYELCGMIDTYDNMPFNVKYNVALENVLYALDKNGIKFESKDVLKDITEYFLFKSDLSDDNKKAMKNLLEKTSFYIDSEKIDIDFMVDPDDAEDAYSSYMNTDTGTWMKEVLGEAATASDVKESIKDMMNKFKLETNKTIDKVRAVVAKIYTKSPENIIEETPNFLTWIRTVVMLSTIGINPVVGVLINFTDQLIALDLKREQADKAVAAYKKEKEIAEKKLDKAKTDETREKYEAYVKTLKSDITKLETYRDNLYTDRELSEKDKVDMADDFSLESAFTNPDVEQYINESHRGVVQQYKAILSRMKAIATAKIKQFIHKTVLSFIEADEIIKFENITPDTIVNYVNPDDNKISMWFAKCMPLNLKDGELTKDEMKEVYEVLDEICDKLNDSSPQDFIISYDGSDDLIYLYVTYTQPIRFEDPSQKDSGIHKMIEEPMNTIVTLEEEIESLKDWNPDNIIDSIDANIDKFDLDDIDNISELSLINPGLMNPGKLSEILKEYKSEIYKNQTGASKYVIGECLTSNIYKLKGAPKHVPYTLQRAVYEADAIDAIFTIATENTAIYEGSASNTIKLASERLKKSITNLSDKEKIASQTLDASLNVMARKVEDASTNKNREAIIKGQVIPSASKTIKLAIAAGAAWAVSPALAVIAALGMIGISKGASMKERQLLLDEINIELQVCEKRIQMAESNNDMKALGELLKIQKKLEREKQRLKYRMKVYYKQDVPDTARKED